MKLIGAKKSPRCCEGEPSNWFAIEHVLVWKNREQHYFSLLLLFKPGNQSMEHIQGKSKVILVLSAIVW